jgi:type VI secretion system protein ImpK
MRSEIVKLVFPVFTTGLQRRQELLAGVPLDFDVVQKELVGLLQATTQTAAWVNPGRFKDSFQGIIYALTCWLDETFIADDIPEKWRTDWIERKLEWELFNSTDRAWMFWQQSGIARKLAEPDALEVFYLCVVLGFRGIARDAQEEATRDWPDAPQGGDVKRWCDEVKEQLDTAALGSTMVPPVSGHPDTNVPPLEGAHHFQTMLMIWAVCLFGLAPCVGYLVIPALRLLTARTPE